MKADNPFDLLLPAAMAKVAEEAGVYKATKHPMTTFFLAITAGVFISIAFVFYITATTGTAGMPFGIAKLIGGICFSLGLILCVICGADLFTSTVLIVVAKASGRITWGQLGRNWLNVYVGNLIGCLLFVLLMWFSGEYMTANGGWGLNVLQTADHKMHHTFIEAVALGILANLMVCLAVWMSYSGRSLMDKAMIMVLPVAMFVASGFEHRQIPVVIGVGGVVDRTDHLQGINDDQHGVGVCGDKCVHLFLQPLPNEGALCAEVDAAWCVLSDFKESILDAEDGILQTEIERGALLSGHVPHRFSLGHRHGQPQSQPGLTHLW